MNEDDALQRVADEMEIRNLVARLAHLADMATDLDVYLDCFTDDAVWEFPGSASENLGHSRTEGKDQIAADRRERRADGFQGPGTNTRHVNTTLAVRVDGSDTAEASPTGCSWATRQGRLSSGASVTTSTASPARPRVGSSPPARSPPADGHAVGSGRPPRPFRAA